MSKLKALAEQIRKIDVAATQAKIEARDEGRQIVIPGCEARCNPAALEARKQQEYFGNLPLWQISGNAN